MLYVCCIWFFFFMCVCVALAGVWNTSRTTSLARSLTHSWTPGVESEGAVIVGAAIPCTLWHLRWMCRTKCVASRWCFSDSMVIPLQFDEFTILFAHLLLELVADYKEKMQVSCCVLAGEGLTGAPGCSDFRFLLLYTWYLSNMLNSFMSDHFFCLAISKKRSPLFWLKVPYYDTCMLIWKVTPPHPPKKQKKHVILTFLGANEKKNLSFLFKLVLCWTSHMFGKTKSYEFPEAAVSCCGSCHCPRRLQCPLWHH